MIPLPKKRSADARHSAAPQFFSTPELAQRLDLLRHLVENSELIPLVRAETGSGKTTMLFRLLSTAEETWVPCRVDANPMMHTDQLLRRLAACFGLMNVAEPELEVVAQHARALRDEGQLPVVMVDDADQLPPETLMTLLELNEYRSDEVPVISVLLFASPAIDAVLASAQLQAANLQVLHPLDIPRLRPAQIPRYVQHLLRVEGIKTDFLIEPAQVDKLFRESDGLPGRINELMLKMLRDVPSETPERPGVWEGTVKDLLTPQRLGLVAGVVALIAAVLLFQNTINSFFGGGTEGEKGPRVAAGNSLDRQAGGAESPVGDSSVVVPLELPPTAAGEGAPAARETSETEMAQAEAVTTTPDVLANGGDAEVPADNEAEMTAESPPAGGTGETPTGGSGKREGSVASQKEMPPSRKEKSPTRPVPPAPTGGRPGAGAEPKKPLVAETPAAASPANPRSSVSEGGKRENTVEKPPVIVPPPKPSGGQTAASSMTPEEGVAPMPGTPQGTPVEERSIQDREATLAVDAAPPPAVVPETVEVPRPKAVQQAEVEDRSGELAPASPAVEKTVAQGPDVRQPAMSPQPRRRLSDHPPKVPARAADRGTAGSAVKRETWLLRQNPRTYTLQVLATGSEAALKKFIQRHKLEGKVAYFRSDRNGKPWYSLLYGLYPDHAAAKAAKAQLPEDIRARGGWPRSIESVQAAIKRVGAH